MEASIREIVHTQNAAYNPNNPFSQAVIADRFVFLSGNIGLDKDTMKLVDGGIVPQIRKTFENMEKVLEASNSSFDKVVKVTIFLKNYNDYNVVNEEYRKVFTSSYPARSCIEVAKLPLNALVEIEAVALRGPVVHMPSKI